MRPSWHRGKSWLPSHKPVERALVVASLLATGLLWGLVPTQDVAVPFADPPPRADGRQFVVVVVGEGSADGLVAQGLGDVVLSHPSTGAPTRLLADVRALAPDRVVILGGPQSVSAGAAANLSASTRAPVVRFAGQDRFETAAAAAASMFTAPVRQALIATADVSPDDARATGSAAGDMPVLLVTPGRLPPSTRQALQRLQPGSLMVAGAVSEAVVQQLRLQTSGEVTRVRPAAADGTSD